MIDFFKQHYPFFGDWKKAIHVPYLMGILTFLFAILFGPILTVGNQKITSVAFIILFMVFGSQLMARVLIPTLFKKSFSDKNWTVGKEIIRMAIELLFAIFLGHLLLKVIWRIPSGQYLERTLENAISTVLALQVFIIPLSIFIKKEIVLQQYLARAKHLNMVLLRYRKGIEINKTGKKLVFKSNDRQKDVKIVADDLIFIQVTDNYIELNYLEQNEHRKALLRNTLKNAKEVIGELSYILQCHRSYLVNLKKVVSIEGNSRGYKIKLQGYNETVPVARNKVSEFDSAISHLARGFTS